MPAFAALVPLALAAFSAFQSAHAAKKQKDQQEEAQRRLDATPAYQTPEATKTLLSDTMSQRNAVNPALMMAYQQAQQQAAGVQANAQRNATSGAEALSAGSAAQSNLQSLLPSLANAQTAFGQQNKDAYYGALGESARDSQLKFQDANARNADRFNFALGQAGAQNAGKWQGINAAASIASNPALWQYLQSLNGNKTTTTTNNVPATPVYPTPTGDPLQQFDFANKYPQWDVGWSLGK